MSNFKEGITVRGDELPKILKGIESGSIIITREGIINPSFLVAVVIDEERMSAIAEAKRYKMKFDEPSPFAKLLSKKMLSLTDIERTNIQEEVAHEERKLNNNYGRQQ